MLSDPVNGCGLLYVNNSVDYSSGAVLTDPQGWGGGNNVVQTGFIIINKNWQQHLASEYDEAEDALFSLVRAAFQAGRHGFHAGAL